MRPEERKCSAKQCAAAAKWLQRVLQEKIPLDVATSVMHGITDPDNRDLQRFKPSREMLAGARAHELRNTLPDD